MKIHGRVSIQRGTSLYHETLIMGVEKKLMRQITTDERPDTKLIAHELSISESERSKSPIITNDVFSFIQ